MNVKTIIAGLGLALVTTSVTAVAANALGFETGVQNSWNNRNGRYYERQNLKIDSYERYQSKVKTDNNSYSVKVDITAPGTARLRVGYTNKTFVPGGGRLNIQALGTNNPVNPDPTFMLVEQQNRTQAEEQRQGYVRQSGNVQVVNQGTENSGYVNATGFFGTR